jgi:hypothetical protein
MTPTRKSGPASLFAACNMEKPPLPIKSARPLT